MNSNPFTFGNPIKDPKRFYGREEDIRQIVNRLLSSAHESTSVVGERRIGKTSLLKHLAHPEVAEQLGMPGEQYSLVYIDFQGLTDITPHRFWQRVLKKIAREIGYDGLVSEINDLIKQETIDLFDLEDLFEMVSDGGLHIVLLMDEFEYVTQNPNFGSDFFGGLRALAIHYNLSLVPATRRELVDLCHSEEIKGSPFFNIFATVVLRPFPVETTLAFVDGYLENVDMAFSNEERGKILTYGGGYPIFVQMAGYYLFEGKQKGLESEALYRQLASDFYAQADQHYTYFWSHASESEKITMLAALALGRQKAGKKSEPTLENLKRLHSRAHYDLSALIKRGLIVEDNGYYRIFSPSLEQWMTFEIAAAPGEEESPASIDEWMKSGGREQLEPVKGTLQKFKKKYWPYVSVIAKELTFEFAEGLLAEMILSGVI